MIYAKISTTKLKKRKKKIGQTSHKIAKERERWQTDKQAKRQLGTETNRNKKEEWDKKKKEI